MLGSALGGKALSLPADFFTYEYVYKNHTRHYHLEGDGSLTGGCGHQEGGGSLTGVRAGSSGCKDHWQLLPLTCCYSLTADLPLQPPPR